MACYISRNYRTKLRWSLAQLLYWQARLQPIRWRDVEVTHYVLRVEINVVTSKIHEYIGPSARPNQIAAVETLIIFSLRKWRSQTICPQWTLYDWVTACADWERD